jgi:hypothetical protein
LLTVVWSIAVLGHELASVSRELEASMPTERDVLANLRKRLDDQVGKLWEATLEADKRLMIFANLPRIAALLSRRAPVESTRN